MKIYRRAETLDSNGNLVKLAWYPEPKPVENTRMPKRDSGFEFDGLTLEWDFYPKWAERDGLIQWNSFGAKEHFSLNWDELVRKARAFGMERDPSRKMVHRHRIPGTANEDKVYEVSFYRSAGMVLEDPVEKALMGGNYMLGIIVDFTAGPDHSPHRVKFDHRGNGTLVF